MLTEILTPNIEIYEFDLTEIDLVGFQLNIDEEGSYLSNDSYRFFLHENFLGSDSLVLMEENSDCSPLILKPEQKDQILSLCKTYTN